MQDLTVKGLIIPPSPNAALSIVTAILTDNPAIITDFHGNMFVRSADIQVDLNISSSSGDISFEENGGMLTTLAGRISETNSEGNVKSSGVNGSVGLEKYLQVLNHKGSIDLSAYQFTQVRLDAISSGSIAMANILAGDSSNRGNFIMGNVTSTHISDVNSTTDFNIKVAGDVTVASSTGITGNAYRTFRINCREDGTSGTVDVSNNGKMSLTVQSCYDDVKISNNRDFDFASINKNIGGVEISSSAFRKLTCQSNMPAPTLENVTVGGKAEIACQA